ncbi:MAG: 1-acyl-sn-glycerol-3-phosphate acyltransferase [Oscillospiraceae bacterium]|nr:1-acyl-sn-glycerol-3-phosphate acyltransferase [Oscillospiraceae bacterium]
MASEKNKSKKMGKPAWGIYHIYLYISALIMRIRGVHMKIDRTGIRGIEEPSLVLAPHISLKDHIIVGLTLLPHRPTFVLSEHFMYTPFIGWVIRTFGHTVTKKMFCPDTGTIRGILRAKSAGNIIVLFPEGRLNAVAHSQKVTKGTPELVKKLGLPVYTITGNGSALVFPKWGEKYRKGDIKVETSQLFSAREVASMSIDEISEKIDEAIFHDDEWVMKGHHYKAKNTAEGLDSILYRCPKCGEEFQLKASGNEIHCEACGFTTTLSDDYRFDNEYARTVNGWFYLQRAMLAPETVMEDDIRIGAVNKHGHMDMEAGEAHLRVDSENFDLTGTVYGEPVELHKKTPDIGGAPYTPDGWFNLYYEKRLFYLIPPDKRRIVKYVNIIDTACR